MNAFFYTFEVDNEWYVYDRYSNLIIEVEPFFRDLLEHYEIHHFEQNKIQTALSDKYDSNYIEEKLKEFFEFSNQNDVLKPMSLGKITFGNPNELKDKYQKLQSQIIVNITEQCNLRCHYCKYSGVYQYARTHSQRKIAHQVLKFIPDFIRKYYHPDQEFTLGFYGGEPLIAFEEIKWLTKHVKSEYPHVRNALTTNGLLLNQPDIVKFLVENNFNIYISIDGNQHMHDRYRRSLSNNGSFQIIYSNIQNLKKTYPDYYQHKLHFSCTITPPYDLQDQLSIFYDLHEKINIVRFNHVDMFDTTLFSDLNLKQESQRYISQKDQLFESYLQNLSKGDPVLEFMFGTTLKKLDNRECYPLDNEPVYPNGSCFPGLERLFITVDGTLGMCEKAGEHLPIGDIFRGFDFSAIQRILDQYETIVEEVCKNCWAYRLCDSCFLSAIKGNELSLERKKEFCRYKRKSIEHLLQQYIRYKKVVESVEQSA